MALSDVIKNISVDVSRVTPTPTVFAKQNENGKRQVIVKLMKDGQPFTIGTGVGGYIQGATAPNPITQQSTKFKRVLTNIDTTANTASFYIAQSMTAEIGITQCEIALYDSTKPDEIICTANINIEVQGTGMSPQDEMASDDYQAIVSIKAEVTAMRDEVLTKTAEAIAAQGAAETAAQNAYNSALGVQKIVAGNEAYTKEEADLKYSVAPRKAQTSTTGELKLADADYGLSYLELQGNSEQYTATGTNLFDVKQLVKTMQGLHPENITLMQDNDGKFMRITNSNWHNAKLYTFLNDITKSYKLGFKTRFVSGDPGGLQISIKLKDATIISTGRVTSQTSYTEVSVTIPVGKEVDYMYFTFGSNLGFYDVLLDSFYLYPEDAPSTEKPTGGYGTPSPEYPSEVRSVGDIPKDVNGVEIRNLLDESMLNAYTIEEQNYIYLEINKLPPGTYTGKSWLIGESKPFDLLLTNGKPLSSGNYIILISKGEVVGNPGKVVVQSGNFGYICLRWTQSGGLPVSNFHKGYKTMITSAAEIDEYRPYIGENNGLVKIESSGVNKVDVGQKPVYDAGTDSINIIKWTPQEIILDQKGMGTSYAYADVNLIVGKTYSFYCRAQVVTIDGSPTNGATTIGFRKYPPSVMIYGQTSVARDGTFHDCYSKVELPEDVSLMLYVNSTSSSGGNVRLIVKDLMVVEGDRTLQEMKALKYQPYYNQITWIPLREPLRGITGADLKLYADKIDKDGNVIQEVDSEVFPKGIVWSEQMGYAWSTPRRSIPADTTSGKLLSEISQSLAVGESYLNDSYVRLTLGKTLQEMNDFSTNNSFIVYYVRKTPIEYQIPAIYIETYDQETNVRCLNKVKPSSMGLDYKIAISSLIKRLEALESAAVNNGGK